MITFLFIIAIDRLADNMEPNDQESQLLWDSLIEHGRKYLGKYEYVDIFYAV